jgi:hypothetical protein
MQSPGKKPDSHTERLRDRIAMVLMLVSAIGALYAFATAVGVAAQAGAATQQVEAWRAVTFSLFAAIFVLLAIWPRRYPWLWEIVIVNKVALTLVEALLITKHATNADTTAIADAVLSVLLITSYFLSRGYVARKPAGA